MLTRMTSFSSMAEALSSSDWFCKPKPSDELAIVMQPQPDFGDKGIVLALPYDQDYDGPCKGAWVGGCVVYTWVGVLMLGCVCVCVCVCV